MNSRAPASLLLSLSGLSYRALLMLFPRGYRRRYGHDLVNDFRRLTRHSYTETGKFAALTVWSRAMVVLAFHGLRERIIRVVASVRFSKPAHLPGANVAGGSGSWQRPPRFAGLQSVDQDVRYALRSFARSPLFSLIAVVTLALGIGASTAIFSVVDGVILRPLPYPESHRLVKVGIEVEGSSRGVRFSNPADFLEWRARTTVFESMAASVQSTMVLLGQGEPERLSAPAVSGGFFDLLGVPPLLGRGIQDADDKVGAPQVAVLSYGLWKRRWGGDSTVVGTTVTLSGVPHTIIGVMPASFRPPETLEQPNARLWLSLAAGGVVDLTSTQAAGLSVVARLKPHVTIAQAGQDLRRVGTFVPPSERLDFWPSAASLHGETVNVVKSTLTTLLGSVGLLLLIACANVANLFLARGTDRAREFAVRAALGAGRRRIVRQLLTECVLLALVGGALGVALAVFGVRAFVALNPGNVPRLEEVGIDIRVLAFALVTATATGIFFGLVPAFRTAREDLTGTLREGGNLMSGRGRNRLRNTFVVTQTALALMLTTGAGLVLNSFIRLNLVDPGFDPEGVLAMEVFLAGDETYESPENRLRFFQELEDRIAAIPNVTAAGAATMTPLGGRYRKKAVVFPEGVEESIRFTGVHYVSSGYFDAMGIPLLRGSGLPPDGGAAAASDIVVNKDVADFHWPNQDPIGKLVRFSPSPPYDLDDVGPWYRVVGVVGNVKNESLERSDFPDTYFSFLGPEADLRSMTIVARTSQGSASVGEAMRQAAWELDPSLPIAAVQSMDYHVAESITSPRFFAWLFATFATIALILASVGIYGAMTYSVGQRISELGLRKALGAGDGDVVRLVIRQGLGVVTVGLALGLVGTLGLSRVLTSFLFGVTPTDPMTLMLVVVALGTVAVAACYVPSRRAAMVDPMTTLRRE